MIAICWVTAASADYQSCNCILRAAAGICCGMHECLRNRLRQNVGISPMQLHLTPPSDLGATLKLDWEKTVSYVTETLRGYLAHGALPAAQPCNNGEVEETVTRLFPRFLNWGVTEGVRLQRSEKSETLADSRKTFSRAGSGCREVSLPSTGLMLNPENILKICTRNPAFSCILG